MSATSDLTGHTIRQANARSLLCLLSVFGALTVSVSALASKVAAASEERHAALSPTLVIGLKTEHLVEPLGIDRPRPRFRWLLESSGRGQLQTAYQVQVASSLELLNAGEADKWDSGKVVSDNSVEVLYGGRELASGARAYWKVRVWDRAGRPTGYSAPSFFEMGLLQSSDWQAKWIAARKGVSSPIFRRVVTFDSPVRRARAYISGIGHYELSINGKKIGDRVLDPASTYYNNDLPFQLKSRVFYATYDVTNFLRTGENVVGVMLGHGWYSSESEPDLFRDPYGDRPRLIVQMNAELWDGKTLSLVSDGSWKTSAGPITYNDLFHGEIYDARLEQPGWDHPGFDDSSWENASLITPPGGALAAQLLPPSRVMETWPAVKMITPKEPEGQFFKGAYVYDFGQHFSGWVRIAVSGPRGAKIELKYGSRIDPEDHTLDNRSNATPVAGARQTDTYILKGEGIEIWEPRFTLHGFRYVEVRGFTEAPSLQNIEARFVRSAVETAGSFSCTNELLNRIHRNIQWTLMSSFQGLLQDAADRGEREGWLGDPGFVSEDYIYNYEVLGFLEKWLNDLRDSQKESGSVPIMSPLHLRRGDDVYNVWPSWQSTYPILVWHLHQYYGGRQILEDHYPHLKRLVDFLGTASNGYLIPEEPLGDHMEPHKDGFSRLASRHTPAALTANAYYYYSTSLVARIAELLGRSRDSKDYRKLADNIRDAFNRKFLDPVTSQYATGSQTSNALPLYLDIVPRGKVSAVMRNLLHDIVDKNDYHVSTGTIGSNALVHVLPTHGAASVMYRLAAQTTYPSLGHQVMKGATTVCETYECGPWISQNMKMFASLDKFLYRDLAGISPASPGYRRLLIQPQPVGDLTSVTASHRTVRGTVTVAWIKNATSFDLKVSVPAGTEADIAIPKLGLRNVEISEGRAKVWKSDAYIAGTPGLIGAKDGHESVVFHAGSGSYDFRLSGAAN